MLDWCKIINLFDVFKCGKKKFEGLNLSAVQQPFNDLLLWIVREMFDISNWRGLEYNVEKFRVKIDIILLRLTGLHHSDEYF